MVMAKVGTVQARPSKFRALGLFFRNKSPHLKGFLRVGPGPTPCLKVRLTDMPTRKEELFTESMKHKTGAMNQAKDNKDNIKNHEHKKVERACVALHVII